MRSRRLDSSVGMQTLLCSLLLRSLVLGFIPAGCLLAQPLAFQSEMLLKEALDLGDHYVGERVPVELSYLNDTEAAQQLRFYSEFHAVQILTKAQVLEAGETLKVQAVIDTRSLKQGEHRFTLLIDTGKGVKKVEMSLVVLNMYIQTPKRPLMYEEADWKCSVRISPAVKGLKVERLEHRVPGLTYRIENLEGIVKIHFQGSSRMSDGPYTITVKPKDRETYPDFQVTLFPMKGISQSETHLKLTRGSPQQQIYLRDFEGKGFQIKNVTTPYPWMKAEISSMDQNAQLVTVKVSDPRQARKTRGILLIQTTHPAKRQIRIPVSYENQDSLVGTF